MEAFAKEPDSYDIVISDMTMPNMTGDVLAQEMLKIKPDLPIIICTGFSRKLSEEGAKELGIKKLIFKPITGVNLSVAVRNVLDQSRQS
jgi:CheY-like chemotaxis protein